MKDYMENQLESNKKSQSKYSINSKLIIISTILPTILQLLLFSFQVLVGVITFWNIVGTGALIAVFAFVIKSVISSSKEENKLNISNNVVSSKDNNSTKKKKINKTIIVQIFLIIIPLAISILFFNIYNNKIQNLQLVESVVVSQDGKTESSTSVSNGEITTTTSESVLVVVEYEFNGEKREAKIHSSTTNKIYVNELKIYINQEGKFVSDYGRILAWKIEAIIFLTFSILMFLIMILRLDVEIMAGTIFAGIAFAILFAVSAGFIENFFYNDILCFLSVFANIGIYMLSCGLLTTLFGNKNAEVNQVEVGDLELDLEKTKERIKNNLSKKYTKCIYCSGIIKDGDRFCENCGSKIDKN